ncbi:RadC family protein [Ferruginibacter sp. SUN106]|uniref:RadC family protein n=1 Tax=Ferruginibacter sp. SUN106 TaxID=2978348 RepID=UPI003D365041
MENFNKPSTSIKNWSIDDRPREKMLAKGGDALSNSELLAILINNGSKDKSAVVLAKEILKLGRDNLSELGKLSLKDLQQVKGIGVAKAITIAAALELGRRRQAAATLEKSTIQSSKDIAEYLKVVLKDFSYEVFAVLFLNRANKINHFEIISRGGITGTVADPRIILKKALDEDATSIVLSHNHPSGSLKPSRADEELTRKIAAAAKYFDIKLIDHIIVSEEGYYSFADNGMI